MPLQFTCPVCGQALEAPDSAAGATGACKFCKASIVAPAAPGLPATPAAGASAAPPTGGPGDAGGLGASGLGASGLGASGVEDAGAAGPGMGAPPGLGMGEPSSGPSGAGTGYDAGVGGGYGAGGGYGGGGDGAGPGGFSPGGPLDGSTYAGGTGSAYQESADLWRRFAASFVDGLLLGAILVPVAVATSGGLTGFMNNPERLAGRTGALQLMGFLLPFLYYAFLESSQWQATVGKKLVGIYVTDTQGDRLTLPKAMTRAFVRTLTGSFCSLLFLVGVFTERNQMLHDMAASTRVVQ